MISNKKSPQQVFGDTKLTKNQSLELQKHTKQTNIQSFRLTIQSIQFQRDILILHPYLQKIIISKVTQYLLYYSAIYNPEFILQQAYIHTCSKKDYQSVVFDQINQIKKDKALTSSASSSSSPLHLYYSSLDYTATSQGRLANWRYHMTQMAKDVELITRNTLTSTFLHLNTTLYGLPPVSRNAHQQVPKNQTAKLTPQLRDVQRTTQQIIKKPSMYTALRYVKISQTIVRGSVCLPTDTIIKQKVFAGIKAHPLQEMFRSVIRDWSLLLLMVPIVIAMILVAMVLIRSTAGYVIYVLYAVAISCFIGFGIFLAIPPTSDEAFILRKNKIISTLCSVISFLIASIIFCIFCSYRAKIKAAVRYIQHSNIFFKDNYYLLVMPFILIGALVLFIFFWTFLTVSFYSMSTPVRQTNQLPFQHYKLTPPLVALMVFTLFYLLWGVFFLIHTGSFIVSGTVVNWQYNRSSPYMASSKSYLSSHMGSVCLGSFLTTLLGLFKIELDQADCAQRDPQKQKQKKCIDWLKSCYGCFCCCCVNYIFKCFHHASYVYQNMTGLAYCHSSSQIYQVIRQQKEQWSIIAFLYLIFDQFIPLTFTVISTLISNILIDSIYTYQSGTPNRILVLIVVAIISYSISQFFIGIYSQTIQSLFVIEIVHNNLLANPEELRIRLSQVKDVSQKPQSPRYSLFSKPN